MTPVLCSLFFYIFYILQTNPTKLSSCWSSVYCCCFSPYPWVIEHLAAECGSYLFRLFWRSFAIKVKTVGAVYNIRRKKIKMKKKIRLKGAFSLNNVMLKLIKTFKCGHDGSWKVMICHDITWYVMIAHMPDISWRLKTFAGAVGQARAHKRRKSLA